MIENVIIASLICTFWYMLFQEDMIFESIGDLLRFTVPDWINKPLFDCLTCMSGVWGLLLYALLVGDNDIRTIVIFIACLGGMNAIIHAMLNFLIAVKEKVNEHHGTS